MSEALVIVDIHQYFWQSPFTLTTALIQKG